MNKAKIITHITKELITYRNSQSSFNPFDIISKGILVNALMNFYVPQEFRIYHTGGTRVSGDIHIEPMIQPTEAYKIHFDVTSSTIQVKLLQENHRYKKELVKKYDRAMKGI